MSIATWKEEFYPVEAGEFAMETNELKETLTLQNCRNILHQSLCTNKEGELFFGEYGNNGERKPVNVYKSSDYGQSWEIIYQLKAGEIEAFHLSFFPSLFESLPDLCQLPVLPYHVREGRVKFGAAQFRRDLLDRLAFDVITVPPLRERLEDILPLAYTFAINMASELKRELFAGFGARASSSLLQHDWPGNVRELRNIVQQLLVLGGSGEVSVNVTFHV